MKIVRCKVCGAQHECTRMSPREAALKRWHKREMNEAQKAAAEFRSELIKQWEPAWKWLERKREAGVAQKGERRSRKAHAAGSTPVASSKFKKDRCEPSKGEGGDANAVQPDPTHKARAAAVKSGGGGSAKPRRKP